MAYAAKADLLTGNIPFPTYISEEQAIQAASDEVDSYLAVKYVTPVALPTPPASGLVDPHRQVRLFLKRVTAQIASARVIMSAAAGDEDDSVHAYGRYLLREALSAIKQVTEGDITLDIPLNPNYPAAGEEGLPLVANGDPHSMVDAFYDLTTPGRSIMSGY